MSHIAACCIAVCTVHDVHVLSLTVISAEVHVATAGCDKKVAIWNVVTQRCIATRDTGAAVVSDLAWQVCCCRPCRLNLDAACAFLRPCCADSTAIMGTSSAARRSLQPTGNVLAMADEAGGVALWRDAIPEDELDIAALRAAPSAVAEDVDPADNPTAQGGSLEGSLGEPGVLVCLRCQSCAPEESLAYKRKAAHAEFINAADHTVRQALVAAEEGPSAPVLVRLRSNTPIRAAVWSAA